MKRRRILGIVAFGLMAILAAFMLLTANHVPRTHLSTTLNFLNGMEPVSGTYKKQGYRQLGTDGKWSEVVALEEVFELPMSLDEAHKVSRKELKPISYTATYQRQSEPPKVIFGLVDKAVNDSVVITMTPISSGRTRMVFKQTIEPGWLDMLFNRMHRWLYQE